MEISKNEEYKISKIEKLKTLKNINSNTRAHTIYYITTNIYAVLLKSLHLLFPRKVTWLICSLFESAKGAYPESR